MRILLFLIAITLHVASPFWMPQKPHRNFFGSVKTSINKFSNDFLEVASEEGYRNVACSPLGALTLLSEASLGAEGKTRRELNRVLPLPTNDEEANALNRYIVRNFDHYATDQKGVELFVRNKMFVSDKLEIKTEFLNNLRGTLDSEPWIIDLTNVFETRRIINNWSGAGTNFHMKNIIDYGEIRSDADLVIVSSAYMKGNWASPFIANQTGPGTFWVNGHRPVTTPTMFKFGNFHGGLLPHVDATFIELPYRKTPGATWTTSMFIILPNQRNGLRALLNKLGEVTVEQLRGGEHRDVNLYLPKFKIESTIDLKQPLGKLGVNEIFGSVPDLRGISDHPVKVVQALQKVSIQVDEGGNQAEATESLVDAVFDQSLFYSKPSIEYKVDHPFVCIIVTNDDLIHMNAIITGSEVGNELPRLGNAFHSW